MHTEALVEEALERVLAGTTAIIVVHRPSTVALADRVALLSDGVIAAVGTHSHLLATVPAYRDVLSAAAADCDADDRARRLSAEEVTGVSVDVEQWRGVAADNDAERTAAEAPDEKATIRLRASSRALLASLLRPHRRLLCWPSRCSCCRTPPPWPARTW